MNDQPDWRRSSFSSQTGTCVELAELGGEVAVRNSNHPGAGTLHLSVAELRGWIAGIRAGGIDDFAT